ncbi:MAG: exodeoxyribonuclease VII small subunit [Clostridiales bacterium]|nr:exodeoxyribonuclease VII small subunit [Clostridiales bacterium]
MNYEEAIKELEEIIKKLENEQLPLKTAQELFERANILAKFSQEELSKTTGKLYQIKKDLDSITEEEL